MTTKQRAQLYHELGKLIGAGLHVDRSVELLLEQQPAASMKAWLEGVQHGLAKHLSVSDAVAQQSNAIPLEVSLLAAGERGGRLETACEHLARYYELRQKSRSKAIRSLIYPIILLHLGLLLPDMPQFDLGGGGGGGGSSGLFSGVIFRLGFAWALIGGLGFAVWTAMKAATTSAAMDNFLNSVPVVGGVRKHWALARFCQVFQTGLLAAFRMDETLHLAGDASQSAVLRDASNRAASSIEAGDPLAVSLKKTGAFPRTFLHSVATAEETGTLDVEMERWAVAEAELAARAQDRMAEWLPRIFYVLVVLYVAYRIISMFASYYGQLNRMMDAI